MCCYIHPSPQSPSLPPFLLAQTAYTYLQVYVKLKSDDHKLKEGTKVLELNREYRSLTDTNFLSTEEAWLSFESTNEKFWKEKIEQSRRILLIKAYNPGR